MFCPKCKSKLIPDREFLRCTACQTDFPLVFKDVPVLIDRPMDYLAANVVKYWKYVSTINQSQEHSSDYVSALSLNLILFEDLIKELTKPVTVKDIRNFVSVSKDNNHPDSYSFNTAYLIRDWAGSEDGEHEIAVIKNSVRGNLVSGKRVLVLGAGMARIATELADMFDSVIAVDFEPNMPFFFKRLEAGNFSISEINLHNTEKETDKYNIVAVSSKVVNQKNFNKVQYVLADASNLPFANGWFDAVVSVYFTDVLPLKITMQEVKRVLRPEGRFVHFGPLEYHFSDISQKHSFNTIEKILQQMNFETLPAERVELSHCKSNSAGSYRTYNNWSMTAIRQDDPTITLQSFVAVSEGVKYVVSGKVVESSQEEITVQIFQQAPVKISDALLDVLKCVRNGCTVNDVISRLEHELQYDSPDANITVCFIESLYQKGIITVK